MAKPHLPAQQPAPRIVHYADPTMPAGGMQLLTEKELMARRAQDRVLYGRWVVRQAEIAERDRKVRHFLIGLGLLIALIMLAAVVVLVWLIVSASVSIVGLLVIPAVILAVGGLAVGGHKCVTIVEHWH